jgi:hypothetical protein
MTTICLSIRIHKTTEIVVTFHCQKTLWTTLNKWNKWKIELSEGVKILMKKIAFEVLCLMFFGSKTEGVHGSIWSQCYKTFLVTQRRNLPRPSFFQASFISMFANTNKSLMWSPKWVDHTLKTKNLSLLPSVPQSVTRKVRYHFHRFVELSRFRCSRFDNFDVPGFGTMLIGFRLLQLPAVISNMK